MLTAILFMALAHPLDSAVEAFERGDFTECVRLIERVEKLSGPTPKSASMRALALNELSGMDVETHRALKVYLKLTEKMSLASNPAHQQLVELEAELRERLKREFEAKQKELLERGGAEEEAAVADRERAADAEAKQRQQRFDERVKAVRHRGILEDAVNARRERDQKPKN